MPPVLKTKDALQSYLHQWGKAQPIAKGAITFDETSDRFVTDPKKLDAIIQAEGHEALGNTLKFFNALGLAHKADVQDGQTYQAKDLAAVHPHFLDFVGDLIPLLHFTPNSASSPYESKAVEPESRKQMRSVLLQSIGALADFISKHPPLSDKIIERLFDNIDAQGDENLRDRYDSITAMGEMPKSIDASGQSAEVVNTLLLHLENAENLEQIAILLSLGNLGGVILKSGEAENVISLLIGTVQRGGFVPGHPNQPQELFAETLQTLIKLKPVVIQTGKKGELLDMLYRIFNKVGDMNRFNTLTLREPALQAIMAFDPDPKKVEDIVGALLMDLNHHPESPKTEAATLLNFVDTTTLMSNSKIADNVMRGLLDTLYNARKPAAIAVMQTLGRFKDFIYQSPDLLKDGYLTRFLEGAQNYFNTYLIDGNDGEVYRVFCQTLIDLKDSLLSEQEYINDVMDFMLHRLSRLNSSDNFEKERETLSVEFLDPGLSVLKVYKEGFDQNPHKVAIMEQLVKLVGNYFNQGEKNHDYIISLFECLATIGEGLTLNGGKFWNVEHFYTWPKMRKYLHTILVRNLDYFKTDQIKASAIKALGVLGRQIANGDDKTLVQITEKLISKMSDDNPDIRSAAVLALRKIHPDFDEYLDSKMVNRKMTRGKLEEVGLSGKVRRLINDCVDKLNWDKKEISDAQRLKALGILGTLKETIKKSDDNRFKERVKDRLKLLLSDSVPGIRIPAVQLLSYLNDRKRTTADVHEWLQYFARVDRASGYNDQRTLKDFESARPRAEISDMQAAVKAIKNGVLSVIDTLYLEADAIIELGKEGEVIEALQQQITANRFPADAARTIATLLSKMAAKATPPLPIEPNPQVANLAIGAALMAHGKLTLGEAKGILQITGYGEITPQLRKGLETLVAGSGDQIVPDVESIDSTVEVEDEVALAERNDPAWLTAAAFMQMVPVVPVGVGVPLH